jgi:hypothetical protein
VRIAVLLVAVAACYKPTAPAGAPCDESAPHCPSGQSCIAGSCSSGVAAIDAPPVIQVDAPPDSELIDARLVDAHVNDASVDAMLDAATDAPIGIDAATIPVHLNYGATLAACMDPALPDLTTCTDDKGAKQLAIDGMVDATGTRMFTAYIRFDTDAQLVGKTITAVSLILTNSGIGSADSDQSGEVWSVSAFTETTLSTMAPTKIGGVALAPTQGAVALGQVVTFVLPPGIVAANQPVYLGLYPDSGDGVQYWDTTGTAPPVLHVDAQ